MEVASTLEWALKRATELGADEAEVTASLSTSRSVKSEGVHLKATYQHSVDTWIRVTKGKRFAITTASSLDKRALEQAVENAVRMVTKAEEDPFWEGLPDPETPLHSWRGFDEGVVSAPSEWLVELARTLISEAQEDPRVKVSGVFASAGYGSYYVFSTRGVSAEDRGTRFWSGIELKASEGGEGFGFASAASRSLSVETHDLVERARRLALDSAKGEKLGGVLKGGVLLRAEPLASLVDALLLPAFNALNVLEGFSPLRDKLGQKVLGNLTVIDDGTMVGGLETSLYDAEGSARRRTVLVEEGVLRGFLHNTYTARRMRAPRTGNAVRARGTVAISRTNLIIKGGEDSEEALTESAKVVVDGFLLSVHTVNSVTGNFSVVASNPYLVKGGELKPLKPVTIAANIYEIADLLTPAKRVKNTNTGIYAPDLLMGGITVSG